MRLPGIAEQPGCEATCRRLLPARAICRRSVRAGADSCGVPKRFSERTKENNKAWRPFGRAAWLSRRSCTNSAGRARRSGPAGSGGCPEETSEHLMWTSAETHWRTDKTLGVSLNFGSVGLLASSVATHPQAARWTAAKRAFCVPFTTKTSASFESNLSHEDLAKVHKQTWPVCCSIPWYMWCCGFPVGIRTRRSFLLDIVRCLFLCWVRQGFAVEVKRVCARVVFFLGLGNMASLVCYETQEEHRDGFGDDVSHTVLLRSWLLVPRLLRDARGAS